MQNGDVSVAVDSAVYAAGDGAVVRQADQQVSWALTAVMSEQVGSRVATVLGWSVARAVGDAMWREAAYAGR
jgi:NADH dehydrogenase FAD-containing subunit